MSPVPMKEPIPEGHDDPDDGAPRSYCVFERDRALPRSRSWSPLTAEAAARNGSARVIVAIAIGVALLSVAWWLLG